MKIRVNLLGLLLVGSCSHALSGGADLTKPVKPYILKSYQIPNNLDLTDEVEYPSYRACEQARKVYVQKNKARGAVCLPK